MRKKGNTFFLQLFLEFLKIENLAVKNNAVTIAFVPHGLVGLFTRVDDGQATMPQTNPIVGMNILEVRTPASQGLRCGGDVDAVKFSDQIKCKYSSNTAHFLLG
jgi:hypothetical protein